MHCFLHHESLGKIWKKIRRNKRCIWYYSWHMLCKLLPSSQYWMSENEVFWRMGSPLLIGPPGSPGGRSRGKEGSMKRPRVGAPGTWWVGEKSAQGRQPPEQWGVERGQDGWPEHLTLPSGSQNVWVWCSLEGKLSRFSTVGVAVSDFLLAYSANRTALGHPAWLAPPVSPPHSKLLQPSQTVLFLSEPPSCWSLLHLHFLWD